MLTTKYTIHESLDEDVLLEYSAFKLGDTHVIRIYADLVEEKLRAILDPERQYVLWGTHKRPSNPYCRKNAILVDEILSKELGLPFVVAEYEYSYDPHNFYDNDIERKFQYMPVLAEADRPRVRDKSVIFFDDSIFKGSVLTTSEGILKGLARDLVFISGIDVSKTSYTEEQINGLYYKKHGIAGLVAIANQPGYTFTTCMMRTLYGLAEGERKILLESLTSEARDLFLKAYRVYIGRDF